MKNGKLELFDDVMVYGDKKGQIRYIKPYAPPDAYIYFVALNDGGFDWFHKDELTYLPKQPVMVYVSDVSEEHAIYVKEAQKLLFDAGPEYDSRYITESSCREAIMRWRFAVPVDQVPEPKPTITKAELQQIQDTIEKIKSGAILVED